MRMAPTASGATILTTTIAVWPVLTLPVLTLPILAMARTASGTMMATWRAQYAAATTSLLTMATHSLRPCTAKDAALCIQAIALCMQVRPAHIQPLQPLQPSGGGGWAEGGAARRAGASEGVMSALTRPFTVETPFVESIVVTAVEEDVAEVVVVIEAEAEAEASDGMQVHQTTIAPAAPPATATAAAATATAIVATAAAESLLHLWPPPAPDGRQEAAGEAELAAAQEAEACAKRATAAARVSVGDSQRALHVAWAEVPPPHSPSPPPPPPPSPPTTGKTLSLRPAPPHLSPCLSSPAPCHPNLFPRCDPRTPPSSSSSSSSSSRWFACSST